MSGLIESVRAEFDAGCMASGSLNRRGCSASLEGVPKRHLVIDLDKPSSPLSGDEMRCDYLLFAEERDEEDWFVPLELKKGRLRPSKVVSQLQAGARAAIEAVGSRSVNFVPVVASGGRNHRADLTKLKEAKVRFGDRPKTVRVMRCGGRLVDVLKRGNR